MKLEECTFINLPSHPKKTRTPEEDLFGDLLWQAKLRPGKYSFSKRSVMDDWGIDLDSPGKLFLTGLPTWFAHLSPVLARQGISHHLVDLVGSNIGRGNPRNEVELDARLRPSSTYLLSPITQTTPIAFEVIEFIRRNRSKSKIIVGGPQATYEGDEFLTKGADIVARGEGEKTLDDLARGKELPKINGISFVKDGQIVKTPSRVLVSNLDDLEPYDYSRLPIDYNPSFYARFFAQRGCPMDCCFCADSLWSNQTVRRKSVARLEEELDNLRRNVRFLDLHIADNCLSSNRRYSLAFAELLSSYDFDWTGETRIDMVDSELLRRFSKAGCVELEYGGESAVNNVLERSKKRLTREKMVRAFEMTKEAGIDVHTNWMVGLPGETREKALDTIDFVCSMTQRGLIDTMDYFIMVPYPGTPVASNPRRFGIRILTKDWARYNEDSIPVYKHSTFSRVEIMEVFQEGNKRFAEALSRRRF